MKFTDLPGVKMLNGLLWTIILGGVAYWIVVNAMGLSLTGSVVDEKTALSILRSRPMMFLVTRQIRTQIVIDHSESNWMCAVLKDTDRSVRKAAAKALGKIGDVRTCTALIESLGREKDDYVRVDIITALGHIKSPQATKAIVALTDDKNEDIRRQAALMLFAIGGAQAVSGLQTMLDDDSGDVRSAVLMGLVNIGGPSVVRSLQKRKTQLGEKADEELLGAVWIAERPCTIQRLKEALKHENRHIRKFALAHLIRLATPQAMSLLMEIARDDDDLYVRSAAKRYVEALIAEDPWW